MINNITETTNTHHQSIDQRVIQFEVDDNPTPLSALTYAQKNGAVPVRDDPHPTDPTLIARSFTARRLRLHVYDATISYVKKLDE